MKKIEINWFAEMILTVMISVKVKVKVTVKFTVERAMKSGGGGRNKDLFL